MQTCGGKSYPAVQYQDDNGTFLVMFDPVTNLPAVVRTRDFDAEMGDANYDAIYSDWRSVGGGGLRRLALKLWPNRKSVSGQGFVDPDLLHGDISDTHAG